MTGLPDSGSIAGRLSALALLLFAVAAIWFVVVQPIANGISTREMELANAERTLFAFTRQKAATSEWLKLAGKPDRSENNSAGILKAPDNAAASADIQRRIRSIVARHGGQLRTLQTLPHQILEDVGFEQISLRVNLTLSNEKLLDFLYSLQIEKPYIFSESVSIRAPRSATPADRMAQQVMIQMNIFSLHEAAEE